MGGGGEEDGGKDQRIHRRLSLSAL
jgi:hypothetical protein